VIAPHVSSAADVEAVVQQAEYPPRGERSSGGPLPQLGRQADRRAVRLPPAGAGRARRAGGEPDEELIAPLARPIAGAARRSQLWVVTHSTRSATGGAARRHPRQVRDPHRGPAAALTRDRLR